MKSIRIGRFITGIRVGAERFDLTDWVLGAKVIATKFLAHWPGAYSDGTKDFDTFYLDLKLNLFWVWIHFHFRIITKSYPHNDRQQHSELSGPAKAESNGSGETKTQTPSAYAAKRLKRSAGKDGQSAKRQTVG